MRTHKLTATLTGAVAVIGIVGTLAGASPSFAAQEPAAAPAVRSTALPATVGTNLGLGTAEAGNVQQWLSRYWRYSGPVDGVLGTDSWMAFQRCLKSGWDYTGAIDGAVRSDTVASLQRMLKARRGYTGPIDGVAGSQTQAAFKRFASGDGPTSADC